MKHKQQQWDVPKSGDALLITPKRNTDYSQLIAEATLALGPILRWEPPTHLFRFENGRKGIVFTEPSPRALVELLVDLLEATEKPVRLEELKHLRPVIRISPEGLRIYLTEEQQAHQAAAERLGLIPPRRPGHGSWDDLVH